MGFLVNLLISLICGIIIGAERELKGRPAGISTQTLVIGASMTFTFISLNIFPEDPTKIATSIVSGVGFLGAGVILRFQETSKVTNLTTAASIWFAAAIGMAIGYNYHLIAMTATAYVIVIGLMPRINKESLDEFSDEAPRAMPVVSSSFKRLRSLVLTLRVRKIFIRELMLVVLRFVAIKSPVLKIPGPQRPNSSSCVFTLKDQ